jgi:hypothetical protein
MTVAARKVLRDLQMARELLEMEEHPERFRVLWVAAVALCRAVGHVLQKIDSKSSPQFKAAISRTYSSWKSEPEAHHIFFEFIEDERNSVLKEYEFGFMSGPATLVVLPDGFSTTLADNLFCPLSNGRFAGEDCRDVLELAVNWWNVQLDQVDRAAST